MRRVSGLRLTESSKINFTIDIMNLLKDILPDVGKKCTIKYVPVERTFAHNAHKILFQFSTVNKSKLEISELVKVSKL